MSDANKSRIILALDTPVEQAEKLIVQLAPHVAGFKVGFRQITAGAAPSLIRRIKENGGRTFYDGKFKDIPNTVADAVAELNNFGVWMLNGHCTGALAMMQAAATAASKGTPPPLVLGVTLLTSLSYDDLHQMGSVELRPDAGAGLSQAEKDETVRRQVGLLALLAKHAGLNGVVASPKETQEVRGLLGEEGVIVTPAIRPTGAKADDQKRVGTARQAILDGSSYLVVGRPIYEAENPISAVLALNAEVEQALAEKEKGAVATI